MIKYLSGLFLILCLCLYSSATSIELQDGEGNRNPTLDKNDNKLKMTVIADFGADRANGIELYITYDTDLLEIIKNDDKPFEIHDDSCFSSGVSVKNEFLDNNHAGLAIIILGANNPSLPTGTNNEIAKIEFNIKETLKNIEIDDKKEDVKIENQALDDYVESGPADIIRWEIINEEELKENGIIVGNQVKIDDRTLMIEPSDVWSDKIDIKIRASLDTDKTTIYFNHNQEDRDKNRYTFYTSLEGENPEHSFDNYFGTKLSMDVGEKTFSVIPPLEIGSIPEQEVRQGEEKEIDLSQYVEDPSDHVDVDWTAESMDKNKVNAEIDQDILTIEGKEVTDEPVEVKLTATDSEGYEAEVSILVTVVASPTLEIESIPEQEVRQGEEKEIDLSQYVEDPSDHVDVDWTAESMDEDKISAEIDQDILTIEGKEVTDEPVEIKLTAADSEGNKEETSIWVTVISISNDYITKIIVNPIIPNYWHIVAIAREEANVSALFLTLSVKNEKIIDKQPLEKRGKIWVRIVSIDKYSPDEVEILITEGE